MRLEDLKRWHWIVIALLAGLALSYVQVQRGENALTDRKSTLPMYVFDQALHQPPHRGQPILKDIVVYKTDEGHLVKVKMLVNFDQKNHPLSEWTYRSFDLFAPVPYKPTIPPAGRSWLRAAAKAPTPEYTVLNYLQDVARTREDLTFKYAWWHEPRMLTASWTAGSVILIGGVWPFVVNLLIGAGLGRRKDPEPEYDLDRFKSEEPAVTVITAPRGDADIKSHLEELERELEINMSVPADAASTEQQPATIRALDGGPLHRPAPAAAREDKTYAGDFYPVAQPGKRTAGTSPNTPPRK